MTKEMLEKVYGVKVVNGEKTVPLENLLRELEPWENNSHCLRSLYGKGEREFGELKPLPDSFKDVKGLKFKPIEDPIEKVKQRKYKEVKEEQRKEILEKLKA